MRCDILFKQLKLMEYMIKILKNKNAKRLYDLNYDYVINNNLRIMDTASISLAKENKNTNLGVFNFRKRFIDKNNRWKRFLHCN